MKLKSSVNEDLLKERQKCNFDIEEVTNIVDGGKEKTSQRRKIENIALSSGASKDVVPDECLGPIERYENAVRKSCIYAKIVKEEVLHMTGLETFGSPVLRRTSDAYFKEISPFLLHLGMFVPTIMGQCTPQQQAYWLPRALEMQIIGTYAQFGKSFVDDSIGNRLGTKEYNKNIAPATETIFNADAMKVSEMETFLELAGRTGQMTVTTLGTELGHGTFIRGLETTATYDTETEQFILHSPTLTSYKWWAGGLGHTANYCIVVAQLYTQGKCHGTHPFIVQIRDEETHMPLPGIKVGDIGPKLGFNTADNGFLGFDKFRIPREHMMMKNAQVLKDGTYVKVARHEKLTYGTMVFVRVTLVMDAAFNVAKAVTIAVRYSAVRRQSQPKPSEPEPQILDYVTQQHKLFICIATSHAMQFTGSWLWHTFTRVLADMRSGNNDTLPELHALSSCLKAICTSDAAAFIEQCRHACGGHGYMLSSNLPFIYSFVTATRTYEGDYTVLLLQTARFLVKAWEQVEAGKPITSTVSYLTKAFKQRKVVWENTPEGIIRSFESVAAGKISACVSSIRKRIASGMSPEDAWQLTTVQLVAASEAHCRAVISKTYWSETVRLTASSSPKTKRVMGQLGKLYLIYWTLERTGDLLRYSSISEEDIVSLQHQYEELLALIRPNAVGLVDAFDIRDEILNSTLGAYDGRVYERLMAEALKSPLNQHPVNDSFHKHLKPFMQGKL